MRIAKWYNGALFNQFIELIYELWFLKAAKYKISRGYEFSCPAKLPFLHDLEKTKMTKFEKKWLFDFTFICSAGKTSSLQSSSWRKHLIFSSVR